jgi:hypothetical protein
VPDAEILQVLGSQARQYACVDLVRAKRLLVLLQAETVEPCSYVHALLPRGYASVSLPYPGLPLRANRETRTGRPARIVLGDPMPEMVKLLPEPGELAV